MRFVVDGMGGDNSPSAVVEGAVMAVNEFSDIELVITGPQQAIQDELDKYQYEKGKITILDATEVISTNEHPVMAIKKKKDSSINKALQLVKQKEVDGIVSAGSTGAFLAGCTLIVGRIKGIDRPALAPIMPGLNGPFMVIDAGANVDCKPHYLEQFALMGKIYFESVLKHENPKVGLINIGSEEEKGNELTKSVHKLLKESNKNFIGNVEPREVTDGDVQVLVCDGFVGNTVLKMYEGVASNLFSMIKKNLMSSLTTKIGAAMSKPAFKKIKKEFDYTEYGGAAFLGVKGICIKAHGSSNSKAFKNAIRQAKKVYDNNIIEKITEEIEKTTENKNKL
ncbi:phosphate acyltransferase PlsX [Clostridium senegalense]|uniref:phosphate acyltransferase PlsX n=1 Tax=Clostridium senegalense TaxID=1465809 RepID=UPI001C1220FD|nr:phosphate acyltransferase PlsX [Clostridium senegalense]MBU5225574.1 phosphate acyltransferase PlsX [Clostridium senegalense]